ncbi:MAG: Uma2 family endonuclease [Chloroflexota bacterium]
MSVMVRQEPIFQTLLKSPKLFFYQSEINDVLSAERKQREAFYDWMDEDTRAEFINREIVMHSPAKDRHTATSLNLSTLLKLYVTKHQRGIVRAETTLVSLTRNDYLPDICFFGQSKASTITSEQMNYPAPDLVIEILSPSTEKTDRGLKLQDYAVHGVSEYWLVDPSQHFVEQYVLQGETSQLHAKIHGGSYLQSHIVEGFRIDVHALFDDEANLSAVQSILVE